MSDTTSTNSVKQNSERLPEFYQLILGDKVSLLYPVNNIETVDFLDSLKKAGWTGESDGMSLRLHGPADSNLRLYVGRVA